jgi:hypothetical protein
MATDHSPGRAGLPSALHTGKVSWPSPGGGRGNTGMPYEGCVSGREPARAWLPHGWRRSSGSGCRFALRPGMPVAEARRCVIATPRSPQNQGRHWPARYGRLRTYAAATTTTTAMTPTTITVATQPATPSTAARAAATPAVTAVVAAACTTACLERRAGNGIGRHLTRPDGARASPPCRIRATAEQHFSMRGRDHCAPRPPNSS